MLEKKFEKKETFFEKEKKRTKKAIEESNDIRRRIEEIEVRIRASEQRAEQEAQRAAKLEEMLKRIGVDPDTALDDVNVSQGASAGRGSGAGV
nr:hypothetical protein [Rickettsia endosymbiont of Ceutorhynchus assimilis]